MKKLILLTIISCLLYHPIAEAGIRFIMDTDAAPKDSKGTSSYTPSSPSKTELCVSSGYDKTSCDSGFFLSGPCPYASGYYADCCPEEYRYTKEECLAQNKTYGTYSCGGYYKCVD